ncbi:MAG: phage tail tip lysozyme [Eubacteriales bacterium]|nr:phage tail tip lysozyme [Eubacteriales bacterium]
MKKRFRLLAVIGIVCVSLVGQPTAVFAEEVGDEVEADWGDYDSDNNDNDNGDTGSDIGAAGGGSSAGEESFSSKSVSYGVEEEVLDLTIETEEQMVVDPMSLVILEEQSSLEQEAEKGEALYEEYTGEAFAEFISYPAGNIVADTNIIYDYLRNTLGLNHAAACGVLANLQCESNFTATAVGDGGTSYGLCQWHLGRFSQLIEWCNANGFNYHLVPGQLGYMQYELLTGYQGVYQYLLSVPDTPQGAFDAAYVWCSNFEIPNDTEYNSILRGKLAQNEFYPRALGTNGKPLTEAETEEEKAEKAETEEEWKKLLKKSKKLFLQDRLLMENSSFDLSKLVTSGVVLPTELSKDSELPAGSPEIKVPEEQISELPILPEVKNDAEELLPETEEETEEVKTEEEVQTEVQTEKEADESETETESESESEEMQTAETAETDIEETTETSAAETAAESEESSEE